MWARMTRDTTLRSYAMTLGYTKTPNKYPGVLPPPTNNFVQWCVHWHNPRPRALLPQWSAAPSVGSR